MKIDAQSRVHSANEAMLNTGSGFVLSWALWVFVVGPLWNIPFNMFDSVSITLLFTALTLVRTYIWRRVFNGRAKRHGIYG